MMQTINTYLPSVTLGAMLLALALVINGQDTLEQQLITQTAVMAQASLALSRFLFRAWSKRKENIFLFGVVLAVESGILSTP